MEAKIRFITELFSDFGERVEKVYVGDEFFRELCEDYILCSNKIQELKKESIINLVAINEYIDLKNQLEREILRKLSKV